MNKRYSIMVRQYLSDKETELCQCNANPEAVAEGARAKFLLISGGLSTRRIRVPKYEHVWIRDNQVVR